MHRFEPSVFRVLTTFVEFHYRTLEPKQLEPKGLRKKQKAGQYAAGWSLHCPPEEGEGLKSEIGDLGR